MEPVARGAEDRRPSAPSLQVQTASIMQSASPPFVQSAVPARLATATITPPATPKDANAVSDLAGAQTPQFNNYLRALHNFNPHSGAVSHEDASLMNASLKEGDLILVHCIHANGWADGTVLNTGDRGWLPTNYCEPYDHPYLRILLNALTQFWDLLGDNEDDNLSTFVRQDYIRGLIAGVRFLLERANCLHRDANQVKKHVGVRRMRKGILADLSSLVQIAKRVQETISEPFAGEVVSVLLEELVTKAFKVVTRAVSFIDVWTQETSLDRSELERRAALQVPATPPVDNISLFTDTSASEKSGLSPMIDSAVSVVSEKSSPVELNANTTGPQRSHGSQDENRNRASAIFTPPDGRAAHRLSLVPRDNTGMSFGSMASEQLAQTHDVCISHIAAFIGHHLHSRPSSELAATTDKLVNACNSMLAIVDEVRARDRLQNAPVHRARDDFEAKVYELSTSIQEVCKSSRKPDDEVIIPPEKSKFLIATGTELIRNTGDCVVKTRQLIESIGDFELTGSPITAQPDEQRYAQEICDSPTTLTASPKRYSKSKRTSGETQPPPPPPKDKTSTITGTSFAAVSSADVHPATTPDASEPSKSVQSLLPPPSRKGSSTSPVTQVFELPSESLKSPRSIRSDSRSPARKDSAGMSIAGSTETFSSSARESSILTASEVSTRATTPDQTREAGTNAETATITSFASAGSARSHTTDDSSEAEAQILHRTYANELTLNKDGQVSGGSLPALVEQLTTHDSAPDPIFVKAFFITFRKFCDPREVAQALISRYDYIGDSKTIGHPVRLRIFNIFKHWLETYWNPEADKDALGDIRYFALHKLKLLLPSAGERLVELTRKIAASYRDGTFTPGLGRIYVSSSHSDERPPDPVVSKQDLNALRAANSGGNSCSILDLDPTEVARQITLLVAKTFGAIHADELLSMDWGKSNTTKAANVRQMCLLNTDLAHLVAESILGPDEAKKRANIIKHWTKIAMACLDLSNYDSVMGIMCTMNSSVIRRLKKTWEQVSKKTRARMDELEKICDVSKNYSALRKRLESPTTPCLPFLGVYLTDLTFVFAGNAKKRELPGAATATAESGERLSVINFDMYMRVAKVITNLQKFQTPYRLREVPEMRAWIEAQLKRMRDNHEKMVSTLHQRSLAVEPKSEDYHRRAAAAAAAAAATNDTSTTPDGSTTPSEAPSEERPKTATSMVGKTQQAIAERFDFRSSRSEKTGSAS